MSGKAEENIEKGMKTLFEKATDPKYTKWILAIGGILAIILIIIVYFMLFRKKKGEKA